MPSSWTYDLSLAGPGELKTVKPVRAEGVAHFRYGCDVETPWRGNSPLWSSDVPYWGFGGRGYQPT